MAGLNVGRAVHHGFLHDLYSRFLQGINIRSIPSECRSRTNSQLRSFHALGRRRSSARISALSHRTRHPRPLWTTLTASATNSIAENYVTTHEPGDQPVQDSFPGRID